MKIANILVFSLILILLSPVAFASSDNSTSDTNINENSDYKNTCENMNIERFRDPIDNDFIDVNTTVYESEYNSQQMKSPTIQSSDLTKYYHNASQFQATFLIQIMTH